jgi:hypothetical protein
MAPAHSQGERFDPRRGRKRYLQRCSAKGCSVVFKQLVIRPFWADFDLRAGHLFTKQLLCQLSYAGVLGKSKRARCFKKPAAIWLRPALWTQTKRTVGLSAVSSHPRCVRLPRHRGGCGRE